MAEVKQDMRHPVTWFLVGGVLVWGFFRGRIFVRLYRIPCARSSDANIEISFGD